jgi:ABC-type phosphate transport system substrate-binding protein
MRLLKTITLLVLLVFTSSAAFAGIAVVVNKANPIDQLSDDEVKNIFLGKKTTWSDGKTIVPVTQEGTPRHEQFTEGLLGKTVHQFTIYWKKALFTGTGIAPKSFKSDGDVNAFINANPFAIGYIDEKSLDGSVKRVTLK